MNRYFMFAVSSDIKCTWSAILTFKMSDRIKTEASESWLLDITAAELLAMSEQAYYIVYKIQDQHFLITYENYSACLKSLLVWKTTAHCGLKGKTEKNRGKNKIWLKFLLTISPTHSSCFVHEHITLRKKTTISNQFHRTSLWSLHYST